MMGKTSVVIPTCILLPSYLGVDCGCLAVGVDGYGQREEEMESSVAANEREKKQ